MIPPGLRLSYGLLSIFPVRFEEPHRSAFGAAVLWASVVGASIGAVQALVFLLFDWAGASGLVAAALAVGTGAVLTRGLHLDGLADVADGLGSGKPAAEALAIMKRSDIGPFGVITLLFTLLTQVAALAAAPHPSLAIIVATVTGRVAITLACTPGTPPARPDGLGARVAQTVSKRSAAVLTGSAMGIATLATLLWSRSAETVLLTPAAMAAALLLSALFLRHLVRRLGGITGDVLGALCELAVTVALVLLTFG